MNSKFFFCNEKVYYFQKTNLFIQQFDYYIYQILNQCLFDHKKLYISISLLNWI